MARRRKPPQITGEDLRRYRREVSARRARRTTPLGTQPYTQRELAAELGVSPNTVARWERGEVPISPAVGALFVRVREVRELHEQVAEHASRLKGLKAENQILRKQLAAAQAGEREAIRQMRAAFRRGPLDDLFGGGGGAGIPAEKVYRRLAQKHHPDKGGNPEVMSAVNELWRAIRKK